MRGNVSHDSTFIISHHVHLSLMLQVFSTQNIFHVNHFEIVINSLYMNITTDHLSFAHMVQHQPISSVVDILDFRFS